MKRIHFEPVGSIGCDLYAPSHSIIVEFKLAHDPESALGTQRDQ